MTVMPLLSKMWMLPSTALARASRWLTTALDVFDEAQQLARKARRRRPFQD